MCNIFTAIITLGFHLKIVTISFELTCRFRTHILASTPRNQSETEDDCHPHHRPQATSSDHTTVNHTDNDNQDTSSCSSSFSTEQNGNYSSIQSITESYLSPVNRNVVVMTTGDKQEYIDMEVRKESFPRPINEDERDITTAHCMPIEKGRNEVDVGINSNHAACSTSNNELQMDQHDVDSLVVTEEYLHFTERQEDCTINDRDEYVYADSEDIAAISNTDPNYIVLGPRPPHVPNMYDMISH